MENQNIKRLIKQLEDHANQHKGDKVCLMLETQLPNCRIAVYPAELRELTAFVRSMLAAKDAQPDYYIPA